MNVQTRPFAPDDLDAVVSLLNRCLQADPIPSEVFQRKVLLDQNFDPSGAPVAICDGKVVGFALGIVRKSRLEDGAPDFDRAWITLLAVDQDYRRSGIAAQLVSGLEQWCLEQGCKSVWISPYAPNYFTPGVDKAAYPAAVAFFESRGYEEILRPLAMHADLTDLETPEWVVQKAADVAGVIGFERFRPELILPLNEWMRSEFPGDWQRYARESMTRITLGEFAPDNVWVAQENGRILGFCQHDNTGRFGPFGVSASERGRGIGAVLMFKCLHAMRAKGLRHAWLLWTDDKVAKLYSEAGFRVSRRFSILRKHLQPTD